MVLAEAGNWATILGSAGWALAALPGWGPPLPPLGVFCGYVYDSIVVIEALQPQVIDSSGIYVQNLDRSRVTGGFLAISGASVLASETKTRLVGRVSSVDLIF